MKGTSLKIMFSLICSTILLAFNADAGEVTEEWVARYSGPSNSGGYAIDMAVDAVGNVYVTGRSQETSFNGNFYTIKYDTDGNELWVAKYNNDAETNTDEPTAITIDEAGNVYVTGRSWGGYATQYDFVTVKYDADGNEKWVRRYNGSAYRDVPSAIAVDAVGNVYVTGESQETLWNRDYTTIKYDANGNEKWVRRYNGPYNGHDNPNAIAVDPAGNVYVSGVSQMDLYNSDYTTVKYDTNGVEQWVAQYNGPGNSGDTVYAIAVDSAGNVFVTGDSHGITSNRDYATIKYDTNGNEQWIARHEGPGDEMANAIALDPAGNIYVTGWSDEEKYQPHDYATVKYDADGNEKWVRRYNGPGNNTDIPSSIAVDDVGNVYVTGYDYDPTTHIDYATVKYDTDGNELWVARYTSPGLLQDRANAIGLDANGNAYVTGHSYRDFVTIKYSSSVDIGGLTRLIEELVSDGVIESELQTSLTSKLNNAQKSTDKENICAAVNQIEAFINQVNAQRGNKIDNEYADEIIDYANSVITNLLSQLPEGESCS